MELRVLLPESPRCSMAPVLDRLPQAWCVDLGIDGEPAPCEAPQGRSSHYSKRTVGSPLWLPGQQGGRASSGIANRRLRSGVTPGLRREARCRPNKELDPVRQPTRSLMAFLIEGLPRGQAPNAKGGVDSLKLDPRPGPHASPGEPAPPRLGRQAARHLERRLRRRRRRGTPPSPGRNRHADWRMPTSTRSRTTPSPSVKRDTMEQVRIPRHGQVVPDRNAWAADLSITSASATAPLRVGPLR